MSPMASMFEEARGFGTATLHEAAGRIGALPMSIKPVCDDFRLCGPAFTVDCPAGDNLWVHRAVYAAKPGDILIVYTNGGEHTGYWGEILNAAAIARGLGGLVIDGPVRDTAGLTAGDFPVFSQGVCISGAGKDNGALGFLDQPIRIGAIVVHPGDLVAGDQDGVVVIPGAQVAQVLTAAAAREADEIEKIRQIRAGARTLDLYDFGNNS
jgi:4-hydroxy-4-methyl-2-oxoglutarate aldolase